MDVISVDSGRTSRGRSGFAAGFDPGRPAVVVSTGVTMYLTRAATAATLRQLAGLAPGSTVAMSFLLPTDLVGVVDRAGPHRRPASVERRGPVGGHYLMAFVNAVPGRVTVSCSWVEMVSKPVQSRLEITLLCGTGHKLVSRC